MTNVKIIAEIGCNWFDLDHAKRMIQLSKLAGADYVKFQIFNKETIKDSPVKGRLESLILTEPEIEQLHNSADNNDIGFILTPMYLEAIELANSHADFIKIRYDDHENQELLSAALDTGKTVFLSVPRRPLGPMNYNPRIKYFYCVPRYPPEPEDFKLRAASLCEGFSSHYPHMMCDLAFVLDRTYKECWVEKHVMIPPDPSIPEVIAEKTRPVDYRSSVTFQQLELFRQAFSILERINLGRVRL